MEKTFKNGLRLVSAVRRQSELAAVALFVRAGSRYDSELGVPAGTAHLVEHLLFKSCRKISSEEIFYEIESRGGKIDGGTTREYATVQVTVPARHLTRVLQVIRDIVFHPVFGAALVVHEKGIVEAEIRREKDQHSVIWDLFHKTLWTTHPFRDPILGTEESVGRITLEDVRQLYQTCYRPSNMVVSVVSQFPANEICRMTAAAGGFHRSIPGPDVGGVTVARSAACERQAPARVHLHRHIHQTHLLIGFRTCPMTFPDRFPLRLIEIALGGSGFSRLFKDLREKRRWAYSFDVVSANYEDTGYFAVYCAADPRHARSVEREIFRHLANICEKGLESRELKCEKEQYKGNLLRRFETNLSVARIAGIETLLAGKFEPFETAMGKIESVRNSAIIQAARMYLRPERAVVVTAGEKGPDNV